MVPVLDCVGRGTLTVWGCCTTIVGVSHLSSSIIYIQNHKYYTERMRYTDSFKIRLYY